MNVFSLFRSAVRVMALGLLLGVVAMPLLLGGEKGGDDELAQKLVNQSGRIQENDIVMISGGLQHAELLEDIAIQVRKIGAFPLVTFNSDRMNRRYFDEVPAKYDTQVPELDLKLATMIDAIITIPYSESSSVLADVPPKRLANVSRTFTPVNNLFRQRNVRSVNLGNALNPTEDRAKRFGVSIEQLGKIYWDGVNPDYAQLESLGKSVQTELSSAKEVHITNPNGTDLRVQISGRPVFVSDGVISEEDMKRGGAACQVWLPAGEVYVTPIAGTANGKVVVERRFFQGKEIQGLELTFKAGKLTSMKAKSGLEALKARYDASGEGKDEFAFVDVGINPNVKLIPNSRMVAWMAAGMVTVGIGNNTWAGGQNESSFFMPSFLPGSTLTIDGEVLVKDGALSTLVTQK